MCIIQLLIECLRLLHEFSILKLSIHITDVMKIIENLIIGRLLK